MWGKKGREEIESEKKPQPITTPKAPKKISGEKEGKEIGAERIQGSRCCCFPIRKMQTPQKQGGGEQLQTLMQQAEISSGPGPQPQQPQLQQLTSGTLSFNGNMSQEDEEMIKSALSTFRAREEEIEKKKMEVKERVQLQLGHIEEENRRLANIREELESMGDPMKKEVSVVRKKIDSISKELKPLGLTCQKKEKEYKEALEALNDKNKEKIQLTSRLMELGIESERLRTNKLEELSKCIEAFRHD